MVYKLDDQNLSERERGYTVAYTHYELEYPYNTCVNFSWVQKRARRCRGEPVPVSILANSR